MSDLTFVSSDDAPSVFATLADDDGVPDLSGAAVRFQMRLASDRRYAVDAAAVIVDETTGEVRYDWQPGDLATPGEYVARWRITFGDGSVEHTDPANTLTVAVQ
jgi:hypothetical protein